MYGKIREPFTIVQPMPRKELPMDSTICDALGPTKACMFIVEVGGSGRVCIEDLTNSDTSKVAMFIHVVCFNSVNLFTPYRMMHSPILRQ